MLYIIYKICKYDLYYIFRYIYFLIFKKTTPKQVGNKYQTPAENFKSTGLRPLSQKEGH